MANWSQYAWFSQGVRRGTLATGFPVTVPVDETSGGELLIASTIMGALGGLVALGYAPKASDYRRFFRKMG